MGNMRYTLKTIFLLVALSALLLVIGYVFGGRAGMMIAFVMSMVMNIGSYWFSDKLVLAAHRAQPLGENHPVTLMVRELCNEARLPMPKVYLIPEWAPNAFATGRDPEHAAVAVTEGILKILDHRQLRGVLAHEIGHVQNRDILISAIVATLASAIMYIAHMAQWMSFAGSHRDQNGRGINPIALILTMILAPVATMLVQTAVSRAREYQADETGAKISRDPEALASALEVISNPAMIKQFQRQEMMPDMQPAFSHLYIVNHFSGQSMLSLFSTHPPVGERVKRLRAMKGSI